MLRIFKYQKRMVVAGLCVFNLFAANYALAEILVVVHPSNTSTFDKSTIKKMFLGKKKSFSNGRTAILLSSLAKSTATEEFNKKVIGKSSNQLNGYWSKMIFTGKGTPPQSMPSADEIISAIAANPDAIGYIDSSEVTDAVKIVATF
jgi:ABC-type phosphate transport system substrate-binding protein